MKGTLLLMGLVLVRSFAIAQVNPPIRISNEETTKILWTSAMASKLSTEEKFRYYPFFLALNCAGRRLSAG